MNVLIASVAVRSRKDAFEPLMELYLKRIAPYSPIESLSFRSEAALFLHLEKLRARTAPLVVLLDSRGRTLTSEDFAAWLARERDTGRQLVVFAIGPADGWTDAARSQTSKTGAGLLLSLGPMTLPHELASVVLAEQVYRAFTILAGHPYHSGHAGPAES